MITVKQLMATECQSSPDGSHWEPALPIQSNGLSVRLRDAWAVFKGDAQAIRQTAKTDMQAAHGIKE